MSAVSPQEPFTFPSKQDDKALLAMKCHVTMMGFEHIIHMNIYGLKVCGKVTTVDALLAACVRHRPDVLIMNLGMDEGADYRLIQRLLRIYPDLKIILMAGSSGSISLQEAIKSGALAYLAIEDPVEAVLRAIIAAHKGQLHIGSLVASHVFTAIASGHAKIVLKIQTLLTPRELEVLRKRAVYNSVKEIAASLKLSPKTVEAHLGQIRQKLMLKHTDDLRTCASEFLTEEQMIVGENILPTSPDVADPC